MNVDFLIVGQGLAGSLLAWELLKHDKTVLVVDRDEPDTSSKVAAGIVSPVTGNRVSPSWRVDEFLPLARRFYWEIEEATGSKLFHHTRIARLFSDEKQRGTWEGKKDSEIITDFLETDEFRIDDRVFRSELGGFEMKQAGWLDVPAFLKATQNHLLERLGFAIARLNADDVKVESDKISWKNIVARSGIIFCQGWEGNQNRFFDWISMNSAKGEILEIKSADTDVEESRIVNRNGWLLPLGDGHFRAGSNYDHDFTDTLPTEAGRSEIAKKIKTIFRPEFTVTSHRAGVRPIIRRSKPVIGRHPQYPNVAFFNGLGSKGVMNGPFAAAALADHLVNNSTIDKELDIQFAFS